MPAHCWLQNLPTSPPTGTHPLPFTLRLFGTTFWLHQTAVSPPVCCVAKSTCWEPFHQSSLGFFKAIQGHPHTLSTHTNSHTPKKQTEVETRMQKTCIHLKPRQFVETSQKHSFSTLMDMYGWRRQKVNASPLLLLCMHIFHSNLT